MVLHKDKPKIGNSRSKGDCMQSFRAAIILALCGLLAGPLTAAQVGQTFETRTNALTNKDVLEMLRAGLGQEVVIAKIKSSACNLDTSPTALKELKAAHVPKKVILAMVQAPAVASPSSAQVAANVPANTESRRIQNIAPEEMWKRVTQCVFPTYPGLAFDSHIAGTVDIGLGISPEGDVGNNSRALDGPPLLVQSAMDAIRQWKFRPNIVQGEMTWSRVRALVRFNTDGTTAVDLAPAILADNFGDPGTPTSAAKEFPRPASSPKCKSVEPWTGAKAKEPESVPDTMSNLGALATEFLKYVAVASCSKKDCTILVTNFSLPDGDTSPYGMQLADELSKELASQNHEIRVIDRGLLQDFLEKDLIPPKSVNPALVRSIAFALKTRFVVLGTTKRTNDDVVQISARLFDVADKNGSGYIAVVNLLAPKSSIDLSPSRPFDSLPPITSTASGESIYRAGLDGVSLPRCTYAPNPPYSEEARKLQLSGIILVDAVINSEGKLENVRIVRGLPDGLNDRTIATMKTWRCNPALKDGKPVPTRVQLEVNFNLRSQ
jgi:TonB family protein